jgi:hypothetical protein
VSPGPSPGRAWRVLVLLAGLTVPAAAAGPLDPLDPFPEGLPQDPEPPPAPSETPPDASVSTSLEAELTTWAGQAAVAREVLARRLSAWRTERGGPEPVDEALDTLGTVLRAVAARIRVDQAPSPSAREAAARLIQAHLAPLVATSLERAAGLVEAERAGAAMARAEAIMAVVDETAPLVGPRPDLDAPRVALARLALAAGRPDRAAGWAQACVAGCEDPALRERSEALVAQAERRTVGQVGESLDPVADLSPGTQPVPAPITGQPRLPPEPAPPLRWRAALSFTPGLFTGTYAGEPVRRGLSGAVDVAFAPTDWGCLTARVAHDRFRVPIAERRLARTRLEVAACPRVGAFTLGRATVAARPVLGLGVSLGRTRPLVGAEATETLRGWGPTGRLEIPVQLGPIEIVPALGVAPYGRADRFGPGASRWPYRFLERAFVGIGLGIGTRGSPR